MPRPQPRRQNTRCSFSILHRPSRQRLAASSPAAETSASASDSGGGAAVFSGNAPEEAGEIDSASMWWYRDSEGADHGPYPVEQMRAWLAAGYFDGSTQVAASYFGEVRRVRARLRLRLRLRVSILLRRGA